MNEKIETILKLADLGYSRIEIETMMAEQGEKPTEMIDILADSKKPNAEKEAPVSEPEKDNRFETLQSSIAALTDTVKALQASNLKHAEMPALDTQETAEDILASLIDRNYRKETK